MIAEGKPLVRACLRRTAPAPIRSSPPSASCTPTLGQPIETDWHQILALYDQLLATAPTSVAALNRAVAMAEVAGPAAALTHNVTEQAFLEGRRDVLAGDAAGR